MSTAVDNGIAEAAHSGIVTQTTLMAAAAYPDLDGAVARIRALGVPCGVHLQLTSGAPLSFAMAEAIGQQFASYEVAARLAPALVRAEWRAQIEAVRAAGLEPSHLDSHQGLHRLPALRPVYFSIARDYGLPVRGGDPAFAAEARHVGVRATMQVLSGWTGQRLSRRELIADIMQAVGADGICELVTHPGRIDARLVAMSAWCGRREAELAALIDPLLADELSAKGVVLTDYRALRD